MKRRPAEPAVVGEPAGCYGVRACPPTARELGLVPDLSHAYALWFGGKEGRVVPASAGLALLPPPGVAAEPLRWEAEVAVADHWDAWFTVLAGRRGFFDR